jgi:hypothetical protein
MMMELDILDKVENQVYLRIVLLNELLYWDVGAGLVSDKVISNILISVRGNINRIFGFRRNGLKDEQML